MATVRRQKGGVESKNVPAGSRQGLAGNKNRKEQLTRVSIPGYN
ncbi:MAG: hypothetical protein ACYSR4_10250 [Planctomycetota bacterium]